jgi:hypothetical protein
MILEGFTGCSEGRKIMKQSYLAVRAVLGLVAVIHIGIGLIGVIPTTPLSVVLVFYGGALQFSPQIAYLLQMFGAYMLTIGGLCVYAIWNPAKNRGIIHGIIFLLLFRGIQRILSVGQVQIVFGTVPGYYWTQTVLFLLVGLALIWLRPRAADTTGG